MIYDDHTGFPAIPQFRPDGRLGSFEGGGGSSAPTKREMKSKSDAEIQARLHQMGQKKQPISALPEAIMLAATAKERNIPAASPSNGSATAAQANGSGQTRRRKTLMGAYSSNGSQMGSSGGKSLLG